jgi:hypothetical protein
MWSEGSSEKMSGGLAFSMLRSLSFHVLTEGGVRKILNTFEAKSRLFPSNFVS